eukprot:1908458-Heterocapsa_arctica.AAC.1
MPSISISLETSKRTCFEELIKTHQALQGMPSGPGLESLEYWVAFSTCSTMRVHAGSAGASGVGSCVAGKL